VSKIDKRDARNFCDGGCRCAAGDLRGEKIISIYGDEK